LFCNSKSTPVAAVEAAAVEADEAVAVEAAAHVRVAVSRLRRLPRDQLPPDRLPLRRLLGRQVVLQPVPGPQAALPARELRRAALAPAVCQGKVPALDSVQPERVRTSPAVVQRPAR
jgi:hypothetical protein